MILFFAKLTLNSQMKLMIAIQIGVVLYALLGFVRVSHYVMAQWEQKTLINANNSPIPFRVPALWGWIFTLLILALVYSQQSAFYPLTVVMGLSLFLLHDQRTAWEQFGLGRLKPRRLIAWSLLICGAVIFVVFPISLIIETVMTFVQIPHPEQELVQTFRHFAQSSDIFWFIMMAALVAPMLEELFFRGFLLTFLKRYTGTWAAIVLSAGVFAFAHANLGSVFQLWFLGIVLGVAYENTGSLLLPMGVHGCFNLFTALGLLLEKGNS